MSRAVPSQRVVYSALRVWVAFSVSSFVVTAIYCVRYGDDPFRNSDPYCVGFIAGAATATFSLCWVVASWLDWPVVQPHHAYFVPLVLLVVALVLLDTVCPLAEADQIPTLLAIAIAEGGAAAYPLHLLKSGQVLLTVGCSFSVLLLLGFASAVTHVVW